MLNWLKSLISRLPLARWSPIVQQVTLWGTRLALLWLLLNMLRPVAPRAMLDEPQTVETIHPDVCVHTRLIDEAEEWKIQRTLQLVREMGATTIVEFFPWAYAEGQEGTYNWFSFDRIVRHAHNQGLRIIARMGLVPSWARPPESEQRTTLNSLPEDSYDDFARFVAAFAERYTGDVDRIIIWNEPNLAFEWGYATVDPAAYARLLQAVYTSAHAANPNVVILAGALAPTLEPQGSPNGLNDLLYLRALYEAGAADYFDALAVHTYGFTEPPQADPTPDALNFRRAELLRQVMEDYGDTDTPVYITESGWNDSPRWTKAVRPSLRIAYTIDAFRLVEQDWSPWLQTLCIWAFRFPTLSYGYPDNFALVGTDFQLRPIYYALQAYARGWQMDNDLWLPPSRRTIIPLIAVVGVVLLGLLIYSLTRPPEILYPAGELRIAVDASYPPFAVATENDLFGIDIDIGRALGERLGVPVRFLNMGYDGLYDSLRAEQADITISALIYNPPRRGEVRYTRPYFDAGLVLVGSITRMEDAPGHAIAYEFGSVGDAEIRRWERLVEQPFQTQPYELPEYALDAARLGVADAALVDAVSARLYLRQHPDWNVTLNYITHAPYLIAVPITRLHLFQEVDNALAAMLEDGTIEAILRRYL